MKNRNWAKGSNAGRKAKVALICNNLFDFQHRNFPAGFPFVGLFPSSSRSAQCKSVFYSIFCSRNIDKLLAWISDGSMGQRAGRKQLARQWEIFFLFLGSKGAAGRGFSKDQNDFVLHFLLGSVKKQNGRHF